eukprot:gene21898-27975_t
MRSEGPPHHEPAEVNPFDFDFEDEDDNHFKKFNVDDTVRAPDVTERMTLLDHSHQSYGGGNDQDDPRAQEDRLKLDKYAQSLQQAGLSEYEVHLQVSHRADEMMARRMQRDLNLSSNRYAGSGLGLGSRTSLENANRARNQFPNSYRSSGSGGDKATSKRTTSSTHSSVDLSTVSTVRNTSSSTASSSSSSSSSRLSSAGLRALGSGGTQATSTNIRTPLHVDDATAVPLPPSHSRTAAISPISTSSSVVSVSGTGVRPSAGVVSSTSKQSSRHSTSQGREGSLHSRSSAEQDAKKMSSERESLSNRVSSAATTSSRTSSSSSQRTNFNALGGDLTTITPPRPPSGGSRHHKLLDEAAAKSSNSAALTRDSSTSSVRPSSGARNKAVSILTGEEGDEEALLAMALAMSLRNASSAAAASAGAKKKAPGGGGVGVGGLHSRKVDALTGRRIGSDASTTNASATQSSADSGVSHRVLGAIPRGAAPPVVQRTSRQAPAETEVGRNRGPGSTAASGAKASPRVRSDTKSSSSSSNDAELRAAQLRDDARAARDLQAKEEADLKSYHSAQRHQLIDRNREAAEMRAFMQTGSSSSSRPLNKDRSAPDTEDALLQLAVSESLRAEGKSEDLRHSVSRTSGNRATNGDMDEDEQYARALQES